MQLLNFIHERMNLPLVWLRSISIRVTYEWRRLGSFRSLFLRVAEIYRSEGLDGVQKRFHNLTKSNSKFRRSGRLNKGFRTTITNEGDSASGVVLIGHPYGILGVGENLRAIATALDTSKIPFHICNAFGSELNNNPLLKDFRYSINFENQSCAYSNNIFCLNANEMDMALSYLGSDIFDKKYNIACWMWELSEFPDSWTGNFRYVDEIWAQSRFVQEAIAKKTNKPVIWMPQPIEPGVADPNIAKKLGVPENVFSFLFFFDFSSHIQRKNPKAVIDAFNLAFKSSPVDSVALVIKMNGMDKCIDDYRCFMKSIDSLDSRIILIDKILSDREIKGLISGCDVFVSLHRSEGFGRGIAEAMYYGKPTIATGYSGNLDFTNNLNSCLIDYYFVPVRKGEYPFWKGQHWAEPDVKHAARWMRRLYGDRELSHTIGARAAESIRATHGAHAVGMRMRERLLRIKQS